MTKPRLASLLLLSTTILTPAMAWAQDSTSPTTDQGSAAPSTPTNDVAQPADEAEAPDVSLPGGAIVVTGQRNRNIMRTTPQVISILSSEEIARTGEGDIAGALGRVTGLSVVGNGYVYVRGLGDRYSLALLNGSPLPSPEPLKRVVPLDLFPTSIVASSLVQKSYSANFPGEFGGGVINLTTKAIPTESFLTIGGGIGWDTETTNQMGYTYYGSKTDWTGWDNGNRSVPSALKDYFNSDTVINPTSDLAQQLGGLLVNGRNAVVQRDDHVQPNFSVDVSAGTKWELGEFTLGVIAAGGYSNKTQTKAITQQRAQGLTADPNQLFENFQAVNTDNRVVANGLLGLGLEWGENSVRWTNVYIHDTDKHASLRLGKRENNPNADYMEQTTAWYERQLIDTQFVGEFHPADNTEIDLRAGYANSKRLAPFEINAEYLRTNTATDDYGNDFVNRLGNGNQDPTTITFSRLNEDVWSAGADVSHQFSPGWTGTVGYAYQINTRTNTRRSFSIYANGDQTQISNFGLLRLDVLLQPGTWYLQDNGVNYGLELREPDASTAQFDSRLLNHAFYGKLDGSLTDALSFDLGVRWEYAKESTILRPIGQPATKATDLKNEYFLPALTLTYEIEPGMQVRLNGSKTIARPQFRELLYQPYFDPDTNRTYQGNPFLIDSQLYNAEARYEWYFDRDQRVALGAFFKRIDNPIESFLTGTETFVTSYANAPKADLYGAEFEVQKYVPLENMGKFFETRRLLLLGNYTFTKSKLKVQDGDTVRIYGAGTGTSLATDYFRDGAPLTGQSEHIANVQIGLEDTANLSQQTILFNYASKRAVSRGLANSGQPDLFEYPGLTIDLVVRQGFVVAGKELELKFEGRNLTGRSHQEYQQMVDGRVNYNTYDVGRTFSLSASAKF
ncbi:TonB-dependent receptor [Novosphingobium sp. PhB57]|jgi:TonB-dependent receptor|uniref:TonB-dependent receptor domain-containing protein n=1 Tax=unclassified Novosphingobium TaxID=2644732 RepID=UPI00104F01DB|nr:MULTISPECIES: TonB-dependent receptor [unclassified Novosphingobium]TCU62192.1 TonB-dependent receptor [Novosphingobium sp. PhB57]TDW62767.1 TonB-dependent receptor [Novosphingobium sp. PhB55]